MDDIKINDNPRGSLEDTITSDYLRFKFHEAAGATAFDYTGNMNGVSVSGTENWAGTTTNIYATPGYVEPVQGQDLEYHNTAQLFDPVTRLDNGSSLILFRFKASQITNTKSHYVFNHIMGNNVVELRSRVIVTGNNLQVRVSIGGTDAFVSGGAAAGLLNVDNTCCIYINTVALTSTIAINGDYAGGTTEDISGETLPGATTSDRGFALAALIGAGPVINNVFNETAGDDLMFSDLWFVKKQFTDTQAAAIAAEYHKTPMLTPRQFEDI